MVEVANSVLLHQEEVEIAILASRDKRESFDHGFTLFKGSIPNSISFR
jgi:hypothetical protein